MGCVQDGVGGGNLVRRMFLIAAAVLHLDGECIRTFVVGLVAPES